jgi:hypothetical protein
MRHDRLQLARGLRDAVPENVQHFRLPEGEKILFLRHLLRHRAGMCRSRELRPQRLCFSAKKRFV